MSRRARITVAYVGTDFHGFAEADGVRTVMGDLRDGHREVVREPVSPVGAGRTDAGVHGWGQVVSLDLPDDIALGRLQRRVNRMLRPDDRGARRRVDRRPRLRRPLQRHCGATTATTCSTRPVPDPFLAATAWHVPQPLNLWAMQLACDPLIGEHDFSSFCRRPKVADGVDPAVDAPSGHQRRVERSPTTHLDSGLLRFEIRANAFCHQMVRSIVGTLVEVGLGKLHAGDMRGILLRQRPAAAGTVAPPRLVLWEVGYGSMSTR